MQVNSETSDPRVASRSKSMMLLRLPLEDRAAAHWQQQAMSCSVIYKRNMDCALRRRRLLSATVVSTTPSNLQA